MWWTRISNSSKNRMYKQKFRLVSEPYYIKSNRNMKKLIAVCLMAIVLSGCNSLKNSLDPTVLLKNPWILQSVLGDKVDVSKFAQGLPFLEFLDGGKISGFDGCNNFNGAVDLAKGLNFGPMASTKMACPGVDSDKFANALNQVTGYKMNGDLLELTGQAGTLLSFLPKKE